MCVLCVYVHMLYMYVYVYVYVYVDVYDHANVLYMHNAQGFLGQPGGRMQGIVRS